MPGRSTLPTSEGQQLRGFCCIKDTVEAVFAAFVSPAARGEVINVASGQPVTIRQMIETVRCLVGGGVPQFGAIAYRSGENMRLFADISKAKAPLNWEPKITLQMGLTLTTQWIINHR